MTARILVDAEQRIVFTYARNPLTYEQVIEHRQQLEHDSRFDRDFDQVISFLDITDVRLSADQVRALAEPSVFSARSRRAIVVPQDELFGLSRMFAMHRELAGEPNVRVVRGLTEAADWLGADAARLEQAFAALKNAA